MHSTSTDTHFERDKNLKALGMTAMIVGTVFLLFFLISWTVPVIPPPPVDEGVEVNLGNSDQGMGNIAPQIPGPPSSEDTKSNLPPASHPTAQPEQNKEVAANDEADAPTIHTSTKPVVKPNPEVVTEPVKRTKTQPTINPTPAPPRPKAVYKGGTTAGAGGNNADSYNGVKNQGIAGGNGDQGKPNGNPNSDSYTGNGGSGNSGIQVTGTLHNRGYSLPRMQDDFNENGTVYVDIVVDANGNVTEANINPHGTTTTSSSLRSIALTKAKLIKFHASSNASESGTIIVYLKLQN
jgi:outer membrane biosynthesis protein TonB